MDDLKSEGNLDECNYKGCVSQKYVPNPSLAFRPSSLNGNSTHAHNPIRTRNLQRKTGSRTPPERVMNLDQARKVIHDKTNIINMTTIKIKFH